VESPRRLRDWARKILFRRPIEANAFWGFSDFSGRDLGVFPEARMAI